jgi:hypothetical protein
MPRRNEKLFLSLWALPLLLLAAPLSVVHAVSSSSSQTVKLTVPLRANRIDNFTMDDPVRGNGTEQNPYVTYADSLDLEIALVGTGTLVVTDGDGNVIYTYVKTTADAEMVNVPADLADGIGLYNFTATYSNTDNPSDIYSARTIFVQYATTPIVPPPVNPPGGDGDGGSGPGTPTTGVLYVGGRAFLVRDLSLVAAAAAVIFAALAVVGLQRSKIGKSGVTKERKS